MAIVYALVIAIVTIMLFTFVIFLNSGRISRLEEQEQKEQPWLYCDWDCNYCRYSKNCPELKSEEDGSK